MDRKPPKITTPESPRTPINEQVFVSPERAGEIKRIVDLHKRDGILMPTKKAFEEILPLQIEVYPQKDIGGSVNYLLGKGVGVEIALQGEIADRVSQIENTHLATIRPHSDFELYALKNDIYTSGKYYPKEYTEIFDAQEVYGEEATKGLKDIEAGYMHETSERVSYAGKEYLVPSLEIMFLDKFLKSGSDADFRESGKSDAFLLAARYDLDGDLLSQLLDDHVIKIEKKKLEKKAGGALANLKRFFSQMHAKKEMPVSQFINDVSSGVVNATNGDFGYQRFKMFYPFDNSLLSKGDVLESGSMGPDMELIVSNLFQEKLKQDISKLESVGGQISSFISEAKKYRNKLSSV